jgi:hypothetical protein
MLSIQYQTGGFGDIIPISMADPLSISASAAGLVSLAITVCQSLATYYGSWKSYHGDIEKLCRDSEIASRNMGHLQVCIDSHEFPAALKQQVESSILACAREIRALETELVLIKDTELPESHQEKLKFFTRRAQYLFKKGALRKIKDSFLGLQVSVDSAVGVLGM